MTREEQIKEAAIDRYGNNGNESRYMLAKVQAFVVGARWADKCLDGSVIKWQTGEPEEGGRYLVTMQGVGVTTSNFTPDDANDKHFFSKYVTAWCKLSDIEPYKEETK